MHLPRSVLVLCALGAFTPLHAQLLLNGSFESPPLSSTQNLSGSFTLGAWSGFAPTGGAGNAGLVVGEDAGLSPSHGNQHFTFNGGNASPGGYVQQTIATTPGTTYSLTFDLGRSGATGYDLALYSNLFDPGTGQTIGGGYHQPGGGIGYTAFAYQFTATGSSTRLRFTDASTGNLNSDLYLDHVTLTSASAIPEPSTYALLAGLGALLLALHRKPRRA